MHIIHICESHMDIVDSIDVVVVISCWTDPRHCFVKQQLGAWAVRPYRVFFPVLLTIPYRLF
jgi:hypothetical protein